jgi:hypothetical protein
MQISMQLSGSGEPVINMANIRQHISVFTSYCMSDDNMLLLILHMILYIHCCTSTPFFSFQNPKCNFEDPENTDIAEHAKNSKNTENTEKAELRQSTTWWSTVLATSQGSQTYKIQSSHNPSNIVTP